MDDDQQVVMVGASFEEIKIAAAAAVKEQIDLQTGELATTLMDGVEALQEANLCLGRLRTAFYLAMFVAAAEAGLLISLLYHRR